MGRPGQEAGEEPMLNARNSQWMSMLLFVVAGLLSLTAAAQRVEIFGGYQFTHLQPAFNANGWNASLTGNFKHVLGITGDFSGAYKQNLRVYTYTVGPVLTARLPVVQPLCMRYLAESQRPREALAPVLPCWWEEALMLACVKGLASALCKRIG